MGIQAPAQAVAHERDGPFALARTLRWGYAFSLGQMAKRASALVSVAGLNTDSVAVRHTNGLFDFNLSGGLGHHSLDLLEVSLAADYDRAEGSAR